MVAAKKLGTNGLRTKSLPLEKIRLDGDTQSREELDQDVIKEYSELMEAGRDFPPLLVVFDGAAYWLVDGLHRRWAAIKANIKKFKCQVKDGTREDARWLSYSANVDHGMRRSSEDKQKAVVNALKHPKGAKLADGKIAEHVGVDHKTVAKYRGQLETAREIPKVTEREGADGKTYNTANIGKSAAATIRQEAMARLVEAEDSRTEVDDDGELLNEHVAGFVEEAEKPTKLDLKAKQVKYDAYLNHITQAKKIWNEIVSDERDGAYAVEKRQRVLTALESAFNPVAQARPHAICDHCKGKGCKKCSSCGWWPRSVVEGLKK